MYVTIVSSMDTITETTQDIVDTRDDEIVHAFCECDETVMLCGLSEEDESITKVYEEVTCVVCAELRYLPCELTCC